MTGALDSLADQADALESGGSENPSGSISTPPPPPESPNIGAIGFMLTAFRELACRMLDAESPKRTLSDENIETCAGVLAAVADKYGLSMGGMFSGPEAAALMVAGPILWTAARELNAELKAKREAAESDNPKGAGSAEPEGT